MSYRNALSPWCIIQHLPKMQRVIVARFRKRNDAEAHCKTLNRLNPAIRYEIIFDPPAPLFPPDSLSPDSLTESSLDSPEFPLKRL